MNISKRLNDGVYEVSFSGSFTFEDHGDFRAVLDNISENSIKFVVLEVAKLDFIDSAGLGMLLLAHDEAKKNSKSISIQGAQGQVRKMLDMSQLNVMFNLT